MPVVRQKDGFTLPVAESSVEPTKRRHDFEKIAVICLSHGSITAIDRYICIP
jgi:hypothetical protein